MSSYIEKKTSTHTTKIPKFLGKRIRHKRVNEEGDDIWYQGSVTAVLDDDEFDYDYDFKVEYDSFEDQFFVKLVQDWSMQWVVIEGKVPDMTEIECECKLKKK